MLLIVLKALASVLAGAYGIFATLTDFHETKNGKQVLSKRGKQGIVFLAIVTTFGLVAGLSNDIDGWNEKANAAKDKADAAKEAAKNHAEEAERFKSLNSELGRTDRFDSDWIFNFDLYANGNQARIKPYMDRMNNSVAARATKTSPNQSHEYELKLKPLSPLFPNPHIQSETSVAELAGLTYVSLYFYKLSNPTSSPDFELSGDCDNDAKRVSVLEHRGIDNKHTMDFNVSCHATVRGSPSKDFSSYQDMEESRVMINMMAGRNEHAEGDFSDFDFSLGQMAHLRSKGNRMCNLIDVKQLTCTPGSPGFYRWICYQGKISCT